MSTPPHSQVTSCYSAHDMELCRLEFEKTFVAQQQILDLCQTHAGAFLPNGPAAIPVIREKIQSALEQRTPLSLVRIGNGEGNAMGMTKASPTPLQILTFYREFVSQNGIKVSLKDAAGFCWKIQSALRSADIVGFRAFRVDERKLIEEYIRNNNAYEALGILYAREFLQNGLSQGYLHGKVITDAWIHLDVLPIFEKLLTMSESVIVITGHVELEADFAARLGSRLRSFISVPVQGVRPPSAAQSHFYGAFPAVRRQLQQDLRGTLVLVGAGLFGKIYCQTARMNGAVALDLGSLFDILAGLQTRPVHTFYDLRRYTWRKG